jgi:serine/threonine protein kinase/tetratricopeptide (TPR) repeat protein
MNREDEIFADALELPAGERTAYLNQACHGDRLLRANVSALLDGHEAAADFLEKPLVIRPELTPGEEPGDSLGRYTLIRMIGEGGCGVVYLAEQQEPVRRLVALKVIKLGMDTRQVIARFDAERQALAMMDHPDIARVFDAGTTEQGRPYFVMEFVDGVPITTFCDQHNLSMEARLELFARVCLALQHAHQKGVIHRDLKPSNILVAQHDGIPSPKVIDFGIAKATQGRLTEHTLLTGVDQFVGTPAYMSPEQAELRELDIDTRSDVYSLGVLLYELLTGKLPYDRKSLEKSGIDEIRRLIREVNPRRPSTCVRILTDTDRAEIARHRQATPMQFTSALRGDLDWIAMRCLEKDRERRYGSAQELADDIRRHVRDEPVLARPPSTSYRVQKFVARNRLACASIAAVATALIVGTVVSVRQAIRATKAERVAVAARDAAEAAGRAEAVAKTDAERRQEQAEELLAYMLGDFRSELKKAGRLNLLDAVGEKALTYFTALSARDLTDTALARHVKALTQIGETRIDQARFPEASASFAAAYNRATELTTRHPKDGNMLFERAQVEFWIGFIARRRGDYAEAREWFVRYRDSAAELVALEGKVLRAQRELTASEHNLAVLELDRSNYPAARAGFLAEIAAVQAMIAAAPQDLSLRFRLADISSWLGFTADRESKFPEALERFVEMSTRVKEIIQIEPTVARWQVRLAESQSYIGNTLAVMGRLPEATSALDQAVRLYDGLLQQDPKNQQWRGAICTLQSQRAAVLLGRGETETALRLIGEARQQSAALLATEPSSQPFASRLAEAWQVEARARFIAGRPDAAEASQQALALGAGLIRDGRADDRTYGDFAQSCIIAGRIALKNGAPEEARRHWDKVLETFGARLTNSSNWRLLDPAAQVYLLTSRPTEARPFIEKLQHFGYRPIDPLAASLLFAAP